MIQKARNKRRKLGQIKGGGSGFFGSLIGKGKKGKKSPTKRKSDSTAQNHERANLISTIA